MKDTNIVNKEYKGIEICISERGVDDYIVIIKLRGEDIWGWEFVVDIDAAMMKAVGFIDQMPQRGWVL
jgi:hypothetical protein